MALFLPMASAVQHASPTVLPLKVRTILNSIAPSDLRGDLSFLASDTLQGRYTPSPGLEVAAEFIASQFRAAGLEPGGDQDYFQTASMMDRRYPKPDSAMTFDTGSRAIEIAAKSLEIYETEQAARIDRVPVVVFPDADAAALKKTDVTGKAVLARSTDYRKVPQNKMTAEYMKMRAFNRAVASSKALIEILVRESQLPLPESRLLPAEDARRGVPPIVLVADPELRETLEHQDRAAQIKTVSVNVPAPDDRRVTVKNVIGILRGSDPKLKDTCVLLTAHYDHIGTTETAKGMAVPSKDSSDRIYNGANDDGSGTVSVVEIARALAKLNPHPKRSIVFMTFFGEERGELGSKYYAKHPVFPISMTVADVNLEQIGRTDSTNGKQVNTASLTGYDYSDVTKYLERAGLQTGIKVYRDEEASDAYFTRSDNDALAEQGVPAHSLSVAFNYPDYHGLGDEWQKIDYDNMARVDRMIALGLLDIANDPKAPAWNALNPKTAPFRQARQNSAAP